MSKIGRMPIKIPEGVKIETLENEIKISGSKGEMTLNLPRSLSLKKEPLALQLERKNEDKKTKSLHGLWRVLINNAVLGVDQGWERKLDFKGVGFKAEVAENKLILSVGFSHPVEIVAEEGIAFNVTKNIITVSGIDKQKVGQMAANIRKIRPVEPYKGKGIKYLEEIPRKKLGKAAKAVATSATQ